MSNTELLHDTCVRTSPTIVISNWRPFEKNTLRGFFNATLPSRLVIQGLTLHHKGESRWVGMPAKEYVDKNGIKKYQPIIDFVSREDSDRFQVQVLAALDHHLEVVPS
jgi:hypothetical protein